MKAVRDAKSAVETILLLKTYQKWFYVTFYQVVFVLCYLLPSSFKIFINVFAFQNARANSKEICDEISFPSIFRKMLMSAFLLRFKAYHLEKMLGNPHFSLWIPIALAKIYFSAWSSFGAKTFVFSRHRP